MCLCDIYIYTYICIRMFESVREERDGGVEAVR